MRKNLPERLGREWLFFDGGMGSLLQARGLKGGELPESWNLTRPDDIREVNKSYFDAGCHIVNSNTFGANRFKFSKDGELSAVVRAGVEIAKEARRLSGREEDAYVTIDIGPTGKLLKPLGDLEFEEAVGVFGEIIRYGAEAGADLVLIETMTDSYEAKAAVLAAKENCDLPVCITVTFDERGKLLTGGSAESVVAMLEGLGVDALGINCGLGPAQMMPIVKKLTEICSVPVIVNPNAGLPRVENGKTVYDVGPDEFAGLMTEIAGLGVQAVGGCCGTTPEHISKMIGRVTREVPFKENTKKHRTVVSSFAKAVEIGDVPVIIGERINPTGKKKLKEALKNNDLEYILGEGIRQEDQGAHILDVNVGLPEIDEPQMMETVVTRLQSTTRLPLQIDTSDVAALEKGLRYYNGKAMVNSVNGKQESMDAVFPLVKKYGGVIVGLALDEGGIPETADGRIKIAEKIYKEAEKYGISKEDIVIDALAMTVSSDSRSALITLETLRRVRDELGGRTILGVSNISFGLPQRGIINSYFLTMAMHDGLSCAIMNPGNEDMMCSYRAFLALSDMDKNFEGYIGAYANAPARGFLTKENLQSAEGKAPGSRQKTGETSGSGENAKADPQSGSMPGGSGGEAASVGMSLCACIEKGMCERAAQAADEGLRTREATQLIDEEIIPALDRVGRDFENGTAFLPQLLMAADAAKAAFEVIKNSMAGKPQETKGRVIVATVKGDIHDIGKNIVKVMLENYGYDVIDLGKDVAPETILEAAKKDDIKLVGLSALMTTTVVSMEDTIKLFRKEKPDTKIVVGGAVMTQEYADQIGADAYAADAIDTVRYADTVFSS